MKSFVASLLICVFAAGAVAAQTVATSRSGQFVIYGIEPGTPRPFVENVATNKALIKLEPALLAVSCERIKQALLDALTVPDQWRGRIRLALHPARDADEEIVVTTSQFNNDWTYEVSLPDAIAPDKLVRAITQVLLAEMINREGSAQVVAPPGWLAEGMPQYLLATVDIDLVLQPAMAGIGNQLPVRSVTREGRLLTPFAKIRERQRRREPLTLEELSAPTMEQLSGADDDAFRDTAVLLIDELLKLDKGGACLAAMLPELAWDPDWMVGFLKAFRPHFKRKADFEKWWALQSAYFAGRNPDRTWTRAESLSKLQEILRTPFAVQLSSNEPPLYTDVSLQAVITGWTLDRQLPLLREKNNLLESSLLRTAPELRSLVLQYRDLLTAYVNRMEGDAAKTRPTRSGKNPVAARMPSKKSTVPDEDNTAIRKLINDLDLLDEHTAAWRFARESAPENEE